MKVPYQIAPQPEPGRVALFVSANEAAGPGIIVAAKERATTEKGQMPGGRQEAVGSL